MVLHTFMTWLIANLLHPVIMIFYFGFSDRSFSEIEFFNFYFLTLVFSLLFSLPSLLITWLLLKLISYLPFETYQKFFTWLFFIMTIPLVNFSLLTIWDGYFFSEADYILFIPACLAAFVTGLARYKYFFKLFTKTEIVNNKLNPGEQ